jgi:hypothetical protein
MFFIFGVIVLVAVSMVAAVIQMNSHTPTTGIYSNNTTSANQTGQMIYTLTNMAPNLLVPAIFVSLALVLIGVLFLFKRR